MSVDPCESVHEVSSDAASNSNTDEEFRKKAMLFLSNIPMDLKTFYQTHQNDLHRKDVQMRSKNESLTKESAMVAKADVENVICFNQPEKLGTSTAWSQKSSKHHKPYYSIKNLKPKVLLQKRIFIVNKTGNIPISLFSVLPYRKEGKILTSHAINMSGRRRSKLTSGSRPLSVMSSDLLYEATLSIDGVPLPGKEEEVSYKSLLEDSSSLSLVLSAPSELEKPEWRSGSHRTVLTFQSYMVSVIDYTKPTELKKDLNARFREKFPKVNITLSKSRSLKQVMQRIAMSQNIDRCAIKRAFDYFDYLVMSGKVIKENRRHCAGVCLLLSSKLNSDLKSIEVSRLISGIEHGLKVGRHDLVMFEFPVLAALQFSLIHFPS